MNWDLTDVETDDDFSPLPAGEYPVVCKGAVVKDTKAGNGKYIEVTLEVADGPSKGRQIWERFNVTNPNPKAQEIGRKQLKKFLEVSGHRNPNKLGDVNELCGLKALANLVVKNDPEWGDKNEVKFFRGLDGSVATQTVGASKKVKPSTQPSSDEEIPF